MLKLIVTSAPAETVIVLILKAKLCATRFIVAADGVVAVDVVGTKVMGFDPDRILHIKWAAEKGLGTAKMSEIEIRGKKISEVEMRCNAMINQKDLMLPPIA